MFKHVYLHSNNRFYTLVLHVCKLITQSTLPKQGTEGKYEFIDFTQDEFKMNAIFERFLMNFCKQHCREEFPEVKRTNIEFQLSIRVSTINLNQDWYLIEARLKDIVERKMEIEMH